MIGRFLKRFMPTLGARPYTLGHDGLLHALEGRRGRGKSYNTMVLLLRCMRDRIPVVTNTRSLDGYRIGVYAVSRGWFADLRAAMEWFSANVTIANHWDDILGAYDSVVILDESTRLFDGRRNLSASVPPVVYEWLKQSRKVRCTVYFVVHSLEWLDRRVSQNIDVMWQVRKEGHPTAKAPDGMPLPVRFYLYGIDPGGVGRVENVNRLVADLLATVPFDVRIARLYHSWELIAEVSGTPSFNVMADIERHHRAAGRHLGVDGPELLARELSRLRAAPPPPPSPSPRAGRGRGAPPSIALEGVTK